MVRVAFPQAVRYSTAHIGAMPNPPFGQLRWFRLGIWGTKLKWRHPGKRQ